MMSSNLLTVLAVVDEAEVRMDLADALEMAGFAAFDAADSDAALVILAEGHDIRLVFMDADIPGSMDGLKLAAAVAHGWPSVKIIVAAGGPISHAVPEGSHLLQKPYGRNDVTKSVRALLAD